MKKLVLTTTLLLTTPVYAGLEGAEVTLRTIAQDTSSSSPVITSLERTVRAGPGVEYPHVGIMTRQLIPEHSSPTQFIMNLLNPATGAQAGFVPYLVDAAIDIANDHITIDFANLTPSARFGGGFQNKIVFQFDSDTARSIAVAEIDNSVTTLGLQPSDVRLVGDELFINVENLQFNPSTSARVKLAVEEGPVSPAPEPATYAMMLAGLTLIGWIGTRRSRRELS
jgi:hypothetical protein